MTEATNRVILLAGTLLAGACNASTPEPAPVAVGEEPRPADKAVINMIDRYGDPVTIKLLDLQKALERGYKIESGRSVYCRMIAKAGRTDPAQCPTP
jgi:hypothetical protein